MSAWKAVKKEEDSKTRRKGTNITAGVKILGEGVRLTYKRQRIIKE